MNTAPNEEPTFTLKTVERFRKLHALTSSSNENEAHVARKQLDKLEEKHPGLTAYIEALDKGAARKRREAEFVEVVMGVRPPPAPQKGDSLLKKAAHFAWNAYRQGVIEPLLDDPDALEEAADAVARWTRGKRGRRRPMPRKSLTDKMEDEIDVTIEEVESDDIDCVRIELIVPLELWDEISDTKGGGTKLLKWLNSLDDADESEEYEEED